MLKQLLLLYYQALLKADMRDVNANSAEEQEDGDDDLMAAIESSLDETQARNCSYAIPFHGSIDYDRDTNTSQWSCLIQWLSSTTICVHDYLQHVSSLKGGGLSVKW